MNEAAQIREFLKKNKLTNRQVSVKSDHNSVTVTVKTPIPNYKALKEFAQSLEKIDRCSITNEILLGGNTYVSVSFDWEMAARVQAEAEQAMKKDGTWCGYKIYGTAIVEGARTVKYSRFEDETIGDMVYLALAEGKVK